MNGRYREANSEELKNDPLLLDSQYVSREAHSNTFSENQMRFRHVLDFNFYRK